MGTLRDALEIQHDGVVLSCETVASGCGARRLFMQRLETKADTALPPADRALRTRKFWRTCHDRRATVDAALYTEITPKVELSAAYLTGCSFPNTGFRRNTGGCLCC